MGSDLVGTPLQEAGMGSASLRPFDKLRASFGGTAEAAVAT